MHLLLALLLALRCFAADPVEQMKCQAKFDARLKTLKPLQVKEAKRLEIEKRAELIDPKFAQPKGTRFYSDKNGNVVANVRVDTRALKLVLDSGMIVLGYRLQRGPIPEYFCADIWQ